MLDRLLLIFIILFNFQANANFVEERLEIMLDYNSALKITFYTDNENLYDQFMTETVLFLEDEHHDDYELNFQIYNDSMGESQCDLSKDELKCDFDFKSIIPNCSFEENNSDDCYRIRYPILINDLNLKFTIKFQDETKRSIESFNIELTNPTGKKIKKDLSRDAYSYKRITEG